MYIYINKYICLNIYHILQIKSIDFLSLNIFDYFKSYILYLVKL